MRVMVVVALLQLLLLWLFLSVAVHVVVAAVALLQLLCQKRNTFQSHPSGQSQVNRSEG